MRLASGARRSRGWLALVLVLIAAGAVVLLRREANGPPGQPEVGPVAARGTGETDRPNGASGARVAEPRADSDRREPTVTTAAVRDTAPKRAPAVVEAAKHPVKVRAAASRGRAAAGERFEIGLEVEIAEGWHINSHQPLDDFLVPTVVEVRGGHAVEVGEIEYPAGERVTLGGEAMSVYAGSVKLVVPVRVAADAKAGEGVVRVGVRFQACDERTCLPPEEVEVGVPVEVGARGRG
jgi:hypothetical protein